MPESLDITAYDMRVFRCGQWIIECGPNQQARFLDRPNDLGVLRLEDMRALAVIAHAARLWMEERPDGPRT